MEKQERTRKENQRSEILGNDSTTRENKRFILSRMRAIGNTLLVQNTIKLNFYLWIKFILCIYNN